MLSQLMQFAREQAASHPGLFHPHTFPHELFQEMGKQGILGATDLVTISKGSAILAGETGSLGFATAWAEQSLVPLALERYAGLPAGVKAGVRTGDCLVALAISEPKAGAHPKYLATRAKKVPGGWMIDGEKAYITNGPIASHLAVLAITDEDHGRKAFSFFLMPARARGIVPVEHPQFDFLRPAQHCGFRLEGCEAPDSALIGQPGSGYEDIARPFRELEDAVGAGSLIALLARAGRRSAALAPGPADEQAAALGELAGLETALKLLDAAVVETLADWEISPEATGAYLTAIEELARRSIAMLDEIAGDGDDQTRRMLHDAGKYLEIARSARQARKMRLGQSYYNDAKNYRMK